MFITSRSRANLTTFTHYSKEPSLQELKIMPAQSQSERAYYGSHIIRLDIGLVPFLRVYGLRLEL